MCAALADTDAGPSADDTRAPTTAAPATTDPFRSAPFVTIEPDPFPTWSPSQVLTPLEQSLGFAHGLAYLHRAPAGRLL